MANLGVGDINGSLNLATLSDGRIAALNPSTRVVSVFSADLATKTTVTVDTSALVNSGMLEARIVGLKGGGFVVVWGEAGYNFEGAIHARVFDARGAAISDDIVVSVDSPARYNSIDVAALASGEFAVAWAKAEPVVSQFGTVGDIAVKTYSATGEEIGFEQTVSTTRAGDQYVARIIGLDNGNFVVGWLDAGQSTFPATNTDVRARIFASNAGQTLTGTTGADTLNGTAKDDTLIGLAGDDTLNGKTGNDTASYAAASASVAVNLALASAQNTGGAGSDTLLGIENLEGSRFGDSLRGNARANVLTGGGGADQLLGSGGNDRLVGGLGNDTLDGGTGADAMLGGRGNDVFRVDNRGDGVIESSAADPVSGRLIGGSDTVIASITYTLPDFVEVLRLAAGAGAIDGNGNGASNTIIGNESSNDLWGGGSGADRLTGGLGADTFKLNYPGANGVPIITDFTPGTDRIIIPENPYLAFFGHAGSRLTAADIAFGPKATTADQHLVYYARTGALFYDADGVGGQAQIKVAVLLGHPELTASDFGLIAI